ncbi:MAG: hypothetical protein LBE35_06280 [Clostridiales bacterium]|nr:hypothetical protein [Clostridiales bacterium]
MNSLNDRRALRENSALITYIAGGAGIKSGATVTATAAHQAVFSQVSQVLNGRSHTSGKIATLEPDFWRLDGSFMLPVAGSNRLEVGFVSRLACDSNGQWAAAANRPILNIHFPTPRDVSMVTIVSDRNADNYVRRVAITGFNASGGSVGGGIVTLAPDGSAALNNFNNLVRLQIQIITMSRGFRLARVAEVHFGRVTVFDDEDILNINTIHEGDPEGRGLPYNQMQVKLANKGRFNVLNPGSGLLPLLEQGCQIEYAHGIRFPNQSNPMFWTNYAGYFLDKWSVNNESVELVAHSRSKFLDSSIFMNSRFPLEHMGDLARRIALDAGINVVVPHVMNTYPRFPGFTGNISHRAALAQLAELSSCMIHEARDGTIHFIDLFSIHQGELKGDIDFENSFAPPEATQSDYYNGITLSEHLISLTDGVLANVEFSVAGTLDIVIPYDSPIWGDANVTVTHGFSISNIRRHTMYLEARLMGNGRCSVQVRGWRVSMLTTKEFYPAPWKQTNEVEKPYVVDLPMFIANAVHIQSVRDWFLERKFNLLRNLVFVKANWRQDPARDLGDNNMFQIDKNGRRVRCRAFYQEMEYNKGILNGTTKAIVLN